MYPDLYPFSVTLYMEFFSYECYRIKHKFQSDKPAKGAMSICIQSALSLQMVHVYCARCSIAFSIKLITWKWCRKSPTMKNCPPPLNNLIRNGLLCPCPLTILCPNG